MVFNNISHKPNIFTLSLRMKNNPSVILKCYFRCIVPAMSSKSQTLSREIKHCGKMSIVPNKFPNFIFSHVKHFSYCKCIMLFKSIFLQIFQHITYSRHFFRCNTCMNKSVISICRQTLKLQIFSYINNCIYSKTG